MERSRSHMVAPPTAISLRQKAIGCRPEHVTRAEPDAEPRWDLAVAYLSE
jgi:hypothetical protein